MSSEEETRGRKSQYVCPHKGCLKVFSKHNRLIVHERTHTGEWSRVIAVRNKLPVLFFNVLSIDIVLPGIPTVSMLFQRPFICDEPGCNKSYARAAHLSRHKLVTHTKFAILEKFKCTEDGCTEEFSTKQNLKKHVKRKHEITRYQCPEEGCLRSFLKHQHLKVHMTEHTGVNSFSCPHEGCGKSFQIPSRLKRHLKTHKGYTCKAEGCGDTFTTWTLLRKHVAQEHASAHTCPECNKVFSQKQWLKMHVKLHQKSREMYVCPREDCGRSYLDQRNLAAHIRSYHENIRFPCTFGGCYRKFATEIKKRRKPALTKVFRYEFDKRESDIDNDVDDDTDKLLTVNPSDLEEITKNREEEQTLFTNIEMFSGDSEYQKYRD
ncbi:hypothetical protein FSP39_009683 [Pinctada imbricata]|uniref:C2H2-type domain-containing protein n=1 Tax=Pinctada imbricata TaxID=66713 RepID=A0AA88YM79_PINIB|nr:hypothetical protein FSP39_009683 [Pinctada imbricata]